MTRPVSATAALWGALVLTTGANDDTGTCSASNGCAKVASGWAQGEEMRPSDRSCTEVLEALQVGSLKVHQRKEPAVVVGVHDAAEWDVEMLSRAKMRSNFGSTRVQVFSPSQAALLGGQTARIHPLRHVLSKLKDQKHLVYVFDKDFFNNASVRSAFPVPQSLKVPNSEQRLCLGGPRAGTQFHSHGSAFLSLLAGRKRWYLHGPGSLPKASAAALHRNVSAWELELLPTLPSSMTPISCIQHAGDTLFVPDSWSHATVNLDETIAVAWQQPTASSSNCGKTAGVDSMDFMCIQQAFATVPYMSAAEQPQRYRHLFEAADKITDGFPAGFLRHLGPYWKVSQDAGALFTKQLKRVKDFLKVAEPHSDDAILGTALAKSLLDAAFNAQKDTGPAAKLLISAMKKAPEAGVGAALAKIFGSKGQWKQAADLLEQHLDYFADDADAATMLGQARNWAANPPR
eukprot:gnl/TRDRNA2_/TRDRNA2_118241_c0_seq1.p1 gnl/TRDRNA2_/TRDRNA2_118241_c0~~gnl/TRDRNA2_/TRDRNA2_118241_c0_seq1.p1  ORF type:complete len:468 (-),score=83.11 gnl/TRDRNA2_/TRDRNA2_118241_c0_seq1:64-1443(-)